MTDSKNSPDRSILASVYILGVFGFYAISAAWLFPRFRGAFDLSLGLGDSAPTVTPNSLMVWFALCYCSVSIAFCLAVYALNELRQLEGRARYFGFGLFSVTVIVSLALLRDADNAGIEVLRPSFEAVQGFAGGSKEALQMLNMANTAKDILNAMFQVSAIGLLSALFLLAGKSVAKTQSRERDERVTLIFYLSAVLLTLIVLTDALFFDFVVATYPSGSAIVSFQRGLLIFFGIVSTMTLALALLAAVHLGAPVGSFLMMDKSDKLESSITSLSKTAGGALGKSMATLAPVCVALLSSFFESL